MRLPLPAKPFTLFKSSRCSIEVIGISRSRPPLVQLSYEYSLSPRSAQATSILIDSSRRRPKAAWSLSENAV